MLFGSPAIGPGPAEDNNPVTAWPLSDTSLVLRAVHSWASRWGTVPYEFWWWSMVIDSAAIMEPMVSSFGPYEACEATLNLFSADAL